MSGSHKIRPVLRALAAAAGFAALTACASMGHPEGGPRDETPPVYLRSTPSQGQLNVTGSKIDIYFDENIKLEDVVNKVVISPVQSQQPAISSNGRHISIELRDTLRPDATYTIDFSDAIRDLNEGNILDGFATSFSTGTHIDTLSIAGMVLEARTLEPAQGMLVGVHSNLSDTAVTRLPFDRIARTNQYGQFVIRNLPEGQYNLFAINDLNRDNRWDRSEDIAFYPTPITPTSRPIEVTDTLRAHDGTDSIAVRQGTAFFPNDILLTWSNEGYKSQYLQNYSRPDSTRIEIQLGAPSDTFPSFTLIDGPAAGRRLDDIAVKQYNWSRDTITYWLTDTALVRSDTLRLAARYLKTDTLDRVVWTDDTLRLTYRRPKPSKSKKKSPADTLAVPPTPLINFAPASRGQQELNRPLLLKSQEPLASLRPEAFRLDIKNDTLWRPVQTPAPQRDSINDPLSYSIHYRWTPGARYRLTIDTLAVTGIYGLGNRPSVTEFEVKNTDEYSRVAFTLAGTPDSTQVVVELLNTSDKPLRQVTADNDHKAIFDYVAPGTYYARAYIDNNANGVWDHASVSQQLQPEDTYYYPKKLNVKKNWDINQTWDLNETEVDRQKPREILKNKPKLKEDQTRRQTDEEDEEDDFYNPGFGNRSDSRGGNRNGRMTHSGGELRNRQQR